MSFNEKIYIEVYDKRGFIGGLFWNNNYFPDYYAFSFISMITWIQTMLYNMNKNLYSKATIVPKEIYAIRLLERMSIRGDKKTKVPDRTKSTDEILERYKSIYYLDNPRDENQKIILDKTESDEICKLCQEQVIINLDTHTIFMQGFLLSLDVKDLCKMRGTSFKDIIVFMDKLNEYPLWITQFDFNVMDEVLKIVKSNRNGFKRAISKDVVLIK